MVLTSEHMKAARALLRWDQGKLSEAAKISIATIKRLEGRPGVVEANPVTIEAIRRALAGEGIEFLNGDGPGVRLRKGK